MRPGDDEPDPNVVVPRRFRRGPPPTKVSVDELVAKGRTVFDRVRPIVERFVGRVKARLQK